MAGVDLSVLDSLTHWDGKGFVPIEHAKTVLACLGNPQDSIKAIHVTGTNGKGTVCALIAAMLYAEGNSVGHFASPHLSDVTERCIINGKPVEPERFAKAAERVLAVASEQGVTLTYFVTGAIASFLVFQELAVDWMVIEVGLGGRLDATNTMKAPRACVITGIGLEHTQWLGHTIEEIAKEKVGISRAGVPLYVGRVAKEAREVIANEAQAVGAKALFFNSDFSLDKSILDAAPSSLEKFPGPHNESNMSLACAAARAVGISEKAIAKGIEIAQWPGRYEMGKYRKSGGGKHAVLFDCAHNADGVNALFETLSEVESFTHLVIVFSVVDRKDWREMLKAIKGYEAQLKMKVDWVFTHSGYQTAVDPELLREYYGRGEVERDFNQAFLKASSLATDESLVLVTGSIFLVGALRPQVLRKPFSTIEV